MAHTALTSGYANTTTGGYSTTTGGYSPNIAATTTTCTPGTWTVTDDVVVDDCSHMLETDFYKRAILQLVGLSITVEEFFEHEFYISPEPNVSNYQYNWNVEFRENAIVPSFSTPCWNNPLLVNVLDIEELKRTTLVHAAASMLNFGLNFRDFLNYQDSLQSHTFEVKEPRGVMRKTLYEYARLMVLGKKVPEEARATLVLLL